jgi:hypothetical protein
MKWLHWFAQSGTTDTSDEIDYKQRYACGLDGVRQWYHARVDIVKEEAQIIKHINYTIKTASRSQNPEGTGVQLWQRVIVAQRAYTHAQLQAAEKRLIVYRDIVLMQGRI